MINSKPYQYQLTCKGCGCKFLSYFKREYCPDKCATKNYHKHNAPSGEGTRQ